MAPPLDLAAMKAHYVGAKSRLLMFDYDGTLTPIVENPGDALPTSRLLACLTKLASDPANRVWVISGRDQNFLHTHLASIPNLGLSAEHGCFFKPTDAFEWINLAETMDMSWQQKVIAIFEETASRTPGSKIEIKKVAVTWHYRRSDPTVAAEQAKLCKTRLVSEVEQLYDVDVMDGKMNLEVRPRSFNKGAMAEKLARATGDNSSFVLCAGDDFTDEDMFRALRLMDSEDIFSCSVGPAEKQTTAKYQVDGPKEMVDAMEMLSSF